MEKMIKDNFGNYLIECEIQLALKLYEFTQNKESTLKVCGELKKSFYGKTFGILEDAALKSVNDEIAKAVCLKLINRDEDYFNNLPIYVQDKLIELYESVFEEDELKEKLMEYLNINTVGKIYQYDRPAIKKEQGEKKKSVLAQLRAYQAEMNQKRKRG